MGKVEVSSGYKYDIWGIEGVIWGNKGVMRGVEAGIWGTRGVIGGGLKCCRERSRCYVGKQRC